MPPVLVLIYSTLFGRQPRDKFQLLLWQRVGRPLGLGSAKPL